MWGMSAPITSSLPNGWQRKRAGPESNGSFLFQELAQMPRHNRPEYAPEGQRASTYFIARAGSMNFFTTKAL
jgi:hypothetical protein